MNFAYFPGCAGEGTGLEYRRSMEEVCASLNLHLIEMEGWNCCGASSAHALDADLSLALPGRNLFLAEQMSMDLVCSCPACFQRHKRTRIDLARNGRAKINIEERIGQKLHLSSKVRHSAEVLLHDAGEEKIKEKVKRSLDGLKAAVYYGCYLARPSEIVDFDVQENPTVLDKIMGILDVECLDWPGKIECCGASLGITNPEMAEILVGRIAAWAGDAGAEIIITACPLCMSNLEMYQGKAAKIPVLYFTEILALAFGDPHVRGWLKKHLIDPARVLEKFIVF